MLIGFLLSDMFFVLMFVPGVIAEMYPEFAVKGSSCLLQAEIVIQFFIRQVLAFECDVVAPVFHAVAQAYVVRKLVWYHVGRVAGTENLRVVAETV